MNIQVQKAWNKIQGENTYKIKRSEFSGAFLSTLTEPLFVVREQYRQASQFNGQLEQMTKNAKTPNVLPSDKSIAKQSYTFFKPFSSSKGVKYLVGYAVDKNGQLLNKTFYLLGKNNLGKIKKMILGKDEDLLYFDDRL